MTNLQLMKLCLDVPNLIRLLSITDDQIRIVRLAQSTPEGLTSVQLQEEMGGSIQNCSIHLRKLFTIGYLNRVRGIAESGGVEYTYTSIL